MGKVEERQEEKKVFFLRVNEKRVCTFFHLCRTQTNSQYNEMLDEPKK